MYLPDMRGLMKSIEVVAAIIERDGLVFATQRGYGDFKSWWEFPGGKIEGEETSEEALVREIHEELDTEISVDSPVMDVSYDYDDFHLDMHCFRCSLAGKEPTLLEHEAAKWVDAHTIGLLKWLPADTEVVVALKERGIVR